MRSPSTLSDALTIYDAGVNLSSPLVNVASLAFKVITGGIVSTVFTINSNVSVFHGFFIFVERLGLKKLLDKCHVINHVYALFVVNFGWVIFRSNGLKNSLRFIKRMIIPEDITASINIYSLVSKKFIVVLIAAVLLSCIIQSVYGIVKNNGVVKKIVMVCEPLVIIALWLLCIMSLVSNTYNPFIYFRF